jgi:hypothetical protein
MNLIQMRARLRTDLHDEDSAGYRWTDDELDRHIARAVRELSLAAPLEEKETLYTSEGSRDLSISTLGDVVAVEAVEHPASNYPPTYTRFSLWGDTLTLLTDAAPGEGEEVNVYYGTLHTLDGDGSTVPAALEELIATGAAGYAAVEWASFATNRTNLGGEHTWRDYLTWGQDRLSAFAKGLARHSRKNAVRSRRLYRPAEPMQSRTTDWGP